jgi:hypothetical protein
MGLGASNPDWTTSSVLDAIYTTLVIAGVVGAILLVRMASKRRDRDDY